MKKDNRVDTYIHLIQVCVYLFAKLILRPYLMHFKVSLQIVNEKTRINSIHIKL